MYPPVSRDLRLLLPGAGRRNLRQLRTEGLVLRRQQRPLGISRAFSEHSPPFGRVWDVGQSPLVPLVLVCAWSLPRAVGGSSGWTTVPDGFPGALLSLEKSLARGVRGCGRRESAGLSAWSAALMSSGRRDNLMFSTRAACALPEEKRQLRVHQDRLNLWALPGCLGSPGTGECSLGAFLPSQGQSFLG